MGTGLVITAPPPSFVRYYVRGDRDVSVCVNVNERMIVKPRDPRYETADISGESVLFSSYPS